VDNDDSQYNDTFEEDKDNQALLAPPEGIQPMLSLSPNKSEGALRSVTAQSSSESKTAEFDTEKKCESERILDSIQEREQMGDTLKKKIEPLTLSSAVQPEVSQENESNPINSCVSKREKGVSPGLNHSFEKLGSGGKIAEKKVQVGTLRREKSYKIMDRDKPVDKEDSSSLTKPFCKPAVPKLNQDNSSSNCKKTENKLKGSFKEVTGQVTANHVPLANSNQSSSIQISGLQLNSHSGLGASPVVSGHRKNQPILVKDPRGSGDDIHHNISKGDTSTAVTATTNDPSGVHQIKPALEKTYNSENQPESSSRKERSLSEKLKNYERTPSDGLIPKSAEISAKDGVDSLLRRSKKPALYSVQESGATKKSASNVKAAPMKNEKTPDSSFVNVQKCSANKALDSRLGCNQETKMSIYESGDLLSASSTYMKLVKNIEKSKEEQKPSSASVAGRDSQGKIKKKK
jgi:hypothetical protein